MGDRPNRVSLLFPFLYVIISLAVIGFAIQNAYLDFGISILIMGASIPVYFAKNYFKSKKKSSNGFIYKIEKQFNKTSKFLQKLFLVAPPYLEEKTFHSFAYDTTIQYSPNLKQNMQIA